MIDYTGSKNAHEGEHYAFAIAGKIALSSM